jgi:hypothetical protein
MLPPYTITAPVHLKNADFSYPQRCEDSLVIGTGMPSPVDDSATDDNTIVRIDKITLAGTTIGYIFISADYVWGIAGRDIDPKYEPDVQRLFGLSDADWAEDKGAIEAGSYFKAVPANYDPGDGLKVEPCVAEDLRNRI